MNISDPIDDDDDDDERLNPSEKYSNDTVPAAPTPAWFAMSMNGHITYFRARSSFGTTKSLSIDPHTTIAAPFAACSQDPKPSPTYAATRADAVAYGTGSNARPEYAPEKARLRAVSHPHTKSEYDTLEPNRSGDDDARTSYSRFHVRFWICTASTAGRYCSSSNDDSGQWMGVSYLRGKVRIHAPMSAAVVVPPVLPPPALLLFALSFVVVVGVIILSW